jgi:hypothetical protein
LGWSKKTPTPLLLFIGQFLNWKKEKNRKNLNTCISICILF